MADDTTNCADATGGSVPRRSVLGAAAVGAVGLGTVLAACGGDDAGGDASGSAGTPSESRSGSPQASAAAGTVLAATADVPVGSGVINTDERVVVVQATAGDFTGLSAVCTHRNCTVAYDQSSGDLVCPCHRSRYDGLTGALKNGPSTKPLPAVSVTVDGDNVVTA